MLGIIFAIILFIIGVALVRYGSKKSHDLIKSHGSTESKNSTISYGGKVYRVDLYSITPEINVYTDKSKSENLYNAPRRVVDTIMVQKTSSNLYYREIITGKLIPVSKVAYQWWTNDTKHYNFCSCLFIYVSYYNYSTGEFWEYKDNSQKDVTYDEVEQYILARKNKYKDFSSFKEYLDYLEKQAEQYYKTAEEKNQKTDEYKIQEMIKKL